MSPRIPLRSSESSRAPRSSRLVQILVCFLSSISSSFAWANEEQPVLFQQEILPILAENCFACHGFDGSKRQGDLRLDSREEAIANRKGMPAIFPFHPEKSELVHRIEEDDPDRIMPPPGSGKKLSGVDKERLRHWIERGAIYERHWAFIPPRAPILSSSRRSQSPIDTLVREKLSEKGLQPSPSADRLTLVRRLCLDLHGFPPTPEEIDSFVTDPDPQAYCQLVERLLSAPSFGEKWGRWWLDLAHYADSDGYLQDFVRPHAWRYRQWVVDSLNSDLPFHRFTVEQLAGDLIPGPTLEQRIATGFLRNTLSNREGGADLEEYRVRQVIDRTVTTSITWLALTTGCAECHDHKFDPIQQKEFYQLYALFNNADEVNVDAPLPSERMAYIASYGRHNQLRQQLLDQIPPSILELQADWEKKLLEAESSPGNDAKWDRALEVLGLIWGQGQGEGQLEGLHIVKNPSEKRTIDQRFRILHYFLKHAPAEYDLRLRELHASEWRTKCDALEKERPEVIRAPTMTQSVTGRLTHLHVRGDFRRKGERVLPGTPASLPRFQQDPISDRLDFARWLTHSEHPLTARVLVNRIWQELFGLGIVRTADNFGVRGERPTHPELLDWLAIELVRKDWSIKNLIREIVLSETYQQSSKISEASIHFDSDNRWLSRQSRIRLSAEVIRDVGLATSGLLDRRIGGPSVRPDQPASVSMEGFSNQWEVSQKGDRYRRGLYTFLQRTSPFAQSVAFDLPDTARSCTRRDRTNTPLQALHLLNDPNWIEMAKGLAARVVRERKGDDGERLSYAWTLTLGREPNGEELHRAKDYLHDQRKRFEREGLQSQDLVGDGPVPMATSELATWIAMASVLMNLDEWITRE